MGALTANLKLFTYTGVFSSGSEINTCQVLNVDRFSIWRVNLRGPASLAGKYL